MRNYIPKNLLTFNNPKTIKSMKYGWKTYILYLSPFNKNEKGVNVCSHASKGCAEACLSSSGFGGMFSSVEKGRINKTNYFISNRELFLKQLFSEILFLEAKSKVENEKLCIRLNGTSDIAWEKFKINGKSIMEHFPNVVFYDYTKNHLRFSRVLPANYHLTFSRSETNEEQVELLLSQGHNVAVVFDKLPETYKGYKVVNGDDSDLTFLQPNGVVLGLKYKKLTGRMADNKRVFQSGFALIRDEIENVKIEEAA